MPETIDLFGISVAIDWKFAFLQAVVFIAGAFRGFAGFGSALLIVPALALIFDPAKAVVIEVLIEIPVTLGLLPIAIRGSERSTVLPMLPLFIIFVPVGALLLDAIDPQIMKIIISIYVLVMVVVIAMQNRLAIFLSRSGVFLTGAASGIAQGMTGMAGPLFVTALLARGENASLTRANIVAVAAAIIALSAVSFWIVGLMTMETIVYALLATPAILLGTFTGSLLFNRLSHWNLHNAILAFLAITATVTLYQAIT